MARSRGDKPGNPNWKKGGPSPNPGGRPAGPIKFRELYDANDDDEQNYRRLVYWRDQDGNPAISVKAIEMLMDRRYGKIATVDENGETVRDTVVNVVVPKYDPVE